MATGWVNDNGAWYFLYNNGSMAHNDTEGGYHVDLSGKMVTGSGWIHVDSWWYYLDDTGKVINNWLYNEGNWYYLYPEGSMAKGWIEDGDSWYYLNNDGYMAHNTKIDGYYVNDDGEWIIGTGWKENGNDWYYVDDSGRMLTNTWIQYEQSDDWYFVNADGKMLKSTYIKDENGVTICFGDDGKSFIGDDGEVEDDDTLDNIIYLIPFGGIGSLIGRGILKMGEKIFVKKAGKEIAEAGSKKFINEAEKDVVKDVGKTVFTTTEDAANVLGKELNGTVSQLKNGYKVEIRNGNKPIVVRVMNEGSGGRANPYYRVSIDGKGSLTLDGTLSNDRGLTHIDMTDDYLSQIETMINKYLRK